MTPISIDKKLRKEIQSWLKKHPLEYYGDYHDTLSKEHVAQIMENSNKLADEIWESSFDYICDEEMELMKELKIEFSELEEYDTGELRDEFLDDIVNNISFMYTYIKNTGDVRIRVVVNQNIESSNPADLFGSQNITELEKQLKLYHGRTADSYYNHIARILKGKFVMKSMEQELLNCTTGWNQFIFYFEADVKDLVDIKNKEIRPWTKIKIPKNVMCGFFDCCNGAGSLLEVELTEDLWIKRQHGKTKYDNIEIVLDEVSKYGVEEVYGLCNVPRIKLEVR